MAIYKIISTGNTILADEEFCRTHHENDWEYIGEEVIPEAPKAEDKLDMNDPKVVSIVNALIAAGLVKA